MNSGLRNRLFEASTAAFEQAAFMFASPGADATQAAAPVDQAVGVAIGGPLSGRLVLGISSDLVPSLAVNMLGEDGPVTMGQQRDALGEIANIICGAVLPALAESGAVFRLGAPETADIDREREEGTLRNAVTIELGLEQGRALVQLWFEEARPS
jgi:CheY-specific phosphatase CheX